VMGSLGTADQRCLTGFLALTVNRRTDMKCLVVGLGSRLGCVDGTWCRDVRTAERLYTGHWAGQGCHPGVRAGVCSVFWGADWSEGKGGDTQCVV